MPCETTRKKCGAGSGARVYIGGRIADEWREGAPFPSAGKGGTLFFLLLGQPVHVNFHAVPVFVHFAVDFHRIRWPDMLAVPDRAVNIHMNTAAAVAEQVRVAADVLYDIAPR